MMKQVMAVICCGVMGIGSAAAATVPQLLVRTDAMQSDQMNVIAKLTQLAAAVEARDANWNDATNEKVEDARFSLGHAMSAYFCREDELTVKQLHEKVVLFGVSLDSGSSALYQDLIDKAFYTPGYVRTLRDAEKPLNAELIQSPTGGFLLSPKARRFRPTPPPFNPVPPVGPPPADATRAPEYSRK